VLLSPIPCKSKSNESSTADPLRKTEGLKNLFNYFKFSQNKPTEYSFLVCSNNSNNNLLTRSLGSIMLEDNWHKVRVNGFHLLYSILCGKEVRGSEQSNAHSQMPYCNATMNSKRSPPLGSFPNPKIPNNKSSRFPHNRHRRNKIALKIERIIEENIKENLTEFIA
jgi:histone deacetylase complex regulatory component SIN3